MGNFVSNQREHRKDGGAMVELKLKKTKAKTVIQSAKYILTWVYVPTNTEKKDFIVLPAKEYASNPSFFKDIISTF